jgi:putative membrane-bound dehydrogenase-like protein
MILLPLLLSLAPTAPTATVTQAPADPLRIYLRAGPKTHGPGEHDHPLFLEEWSELLAERGAKVEGSLHFPSAEELARTDVLVLYAAEGGTLDPGQRADLDTYLARGGGIVALHDAVCGNDAHWFKTIIGGAWEHGHSKWHTGKVGLYMELAEHPITRGIPHFDLTDEIYHDLHLDEDAQILANSFHTIFDVTPQLWTLEREDYRAFVSLQGHYHKTFSHPAWRAILLRGIAWAGKREADLFLTASELGSLRYPPGGPKRPDEALGSFELHPDFTMQCVASEPDVVNPISIDWDNRGRMWVACTPGYPYKEKFSGIPAHDQILILEDTDGDGTMDKRKVFYEGLDLVTSLVRHRDGVIVSASPQIIFLRDTDGDDVADTEEVLYEGFGYGDTHAVLSNLRWGPDGWIYCTQGYSGGASRDIQGGDEDSFGHIPNGLARFRPDGSAIELVSSYGSNTWGLDFDADGELFFTMANGSHLRHVVMSESQLRGRRVGGVNTWKDIVDHRKVFPAHHDERKSYLQIDFVGGFTAAAGCLIQSGAAWPKEFLGNHFVCEPTVNLVHRDVLTPAGVTFTASKPRQAEFLASSDLWFRPIHLRTGPDGAMYVLDFYNQAVVHNDPRGPKHGPTNAAVRPDRDKLHGRIWRVQHKNAAGQNAVIMPLREDPVGLIQFLSHDASWQRRNAERLLREGPGTKVLSALVEALRFSKFTHTRLHSLNLIHDLAPGPAQRLAAVNMALRDTHPAVRRRAAWLAGPVLEELPSAGILGTALVELAETTTDARTRLGALTSLGSTTPGSQSLGRLAELYPKLEDDWSRSALLGAMLTNPAASLASLLKLSEDGQDCTSVVAELCRRIGERREADLTGETIQVLAKAASGNGASIAALHRLHETLGSRFKPDQNPATVVALAALLNHESLDVATASLPLASRWDDAGLTESMNGLGNRLLVSAQDPESSYGSCLKCVRSLLAMEAHQPAALEVASEMLATHAPLDVQLQTIDILRGSNAPGVGAVLAARLPSLGRQARDAAFDAILLRDERTSSLMDALEQQALQPQDLGPRLLHRLRYHPKDALAQRAKTLLTSTTNTAVAQQLAQLLPLVSAPGNPERGAELFAEHCGTCHVFEGRGAEVGPNLTGMGAHGIEELLGIVLDPNREVDPAYVEFVAETVEGTTVTGIMVRETDEAVVLRNTGGDVEVSRDDLETLRSTGMSLMPTGLGDLGPDVLRDIMAHVTRGTQGFRILSLDAVANVDSGQHLFDDLRNEGYTFRKMGLLQVDGVPYEIPDPANQPSGNNIIVLKGGIDRSQTAKTDYPQRLVVPVGQELTSVHVLGGVAAWGHPYGNRPIGPCVRWTWVFDDGTRSEVILNDGEHFADWIRHHDVPGSTFVPNLLARGPGQVRYFRMDLPAARIVEAIELESFDNHTSPVFLALTAENGEGHDAPAPPEADDQSQVNTWILGGGSSHDFARWFNTEDVALLSAGSDREVRYTDVPGDIVGVLDPEDVLIFCTNQGLAAPVRRSIEEHLDAGGALLALHAGTWFNWSDWPALHGSILGAGARGHEPLRVFEVRVEDADHAAMEGVPDSFRLSDELYRAEAPADAVGFQVLARGFSEHTSDSFPVVWEPEVESGRVLVITLGHDAGAHEHAAFRSLLTSGIRWLEQAR